MKIKSRQAPSKQLSLRIPSDQHDELTSCAVSKGISISDEAKERLDIAKQYLSTKELLRLTELRLKRVIFNMTCAVAGLSDAQIIEAEARYIEISKNGVKHEK